MWPLWRARFVRRALGLSLDEFADNYGIPVLTLRAWEQHEVEPSIAETGCLDASLHAPNAIRKSAE